MKNMHLFISNVLFLSRIMLENWEKVQNSNKFQIAELLGQDDGADSWQKPVGTGVKLNVDAAIFS